MFTGGISAGVLDRGIVETIDDLVDVDCVHLL
jgi:hypothetical protein